MNNTPTFGIITLAFGHRKYLQQAESLAFSIKLHMPGIPVAIVTDAETVHPVFDDRIAVDATHGLGTIQKAWLDIYSPYDHTLFIDSDCLVTRPFHKELADIKQFEFTPIMGDYLGLNDKDDLYMENLGDTLRKIGVESFPKFNGGVYFFKKSEITKAILEEARHISTRATELRLKSFDRGGPADETIIGLALAKLDVRPLYKDGGDLMRTPIGSTGPIHINVLGGGCTFIKWGHPVNPAICHFAAPYSRYSQYAYNQFLVRHPHSSAFIKKLAQQYYRIERKIINHMNGHK